MRSRKIVYVLLILIGLLQIIGYMIGSRSVRGLGTAFTSSPLPIVFTQVKGIETFALDFTLEYTSVNGITKRLDITPVVYSKFNGPYNRRNVYGAAFAYGPILPETLRNSILKNGFCGKCFLKEDLEITEEVKHASIHITSKTKNDTRQWDILLDCGK